MPLDLFSIFSHLNCLTLAAANSDLHALVYASPTACCLESKADRQSVKVHAKVLESRQPAFQIAMTPCLLSQLHRAADLPACLTIELLQSAHGAAVHHCAAITGNINLFCIMNLRTAAVRQLPILAPVSKLDEVNGPV